MLGSSLLSADGPIDTATALAGKKAIALYFSAHWCPPCRGFTPVFADAYTKHLKAKGLEVVFCSSDRDDGQFKDYFGEQPWLALPYEARDRKNTLSKKFKVSGIPSLVILNPDGTTITTDGRSCISEDPEGKEFPWTPPTLFDSLGDEFLSGIDGETVSIDEVKESASYIGLYFSAHWCPPCRKFTPDLIKAYKEHLKAKGLEIIFVSSDKDQRQFLEYYGEMPWLAIPQGDPRKNKLSKAFGVQGIPAFVVVNAKTGETVTKDARSAVSSDPEGAEFPWHPPALNNLSKGQGVENLNEETSLCVLLDGCDKATTDSAKEVLTRVAEKSKESGGDIVFFYAPEAEGPVEQIRKLTKLEAAGTPQMVLLDIPDSGGYYLSPATSVTEETVRTFLDMYKAKALDRLQLG